MRRGGLLCDPRFALVRRGRVGQADWSARHARQEQPGVLEERGAALYKNHPGVIFDLYNEPHNVSWDIWQKGGTGDREGGPAATPAKTYEAVGMQSLLDAVRAAGAKNVVIAGGLDWAYDMSGFLAGKQLADPRGNGVIYANHAYPFKGDTVERWIAKMEAATKQIPVIVSEFGSDPRGAGRPPGEQWVRQVLQALQDHDWNWTAWDLHPAAGPRLISDWNYTPTPTFGKWVKQELAGTSPDARIPSGATSSAASAGQWPTARPLGIFEAIRTSARCFTPGRSPTTRPAAPIR